MSARPALLCSSCSAPLPRGWAEFTAAERAAFALLQPYGFDTELGGGGSLLLSRYYPNGGHVWATVLEGGGLPESDNWHLCVYLPTADGGTTEAVGQWTSESSPLSLCEAAGAACALASDLDAALPTRAEKASMGPAAAAEAAADAAADAEALGSVPCPAGFTAWTDGIAQGFYLRTSADDSGFVIYSTRDGQEEPRASGRGGWAIMAGVGNLDSAEFVRLLDLTDESGMAADAALALACQVVDGATEHAAAAFTLDKLSRTDVGIILAGLEILQPDAESDERRRARLEERTRALID